MISIVANKIKITSFNKLQLTGFITEEDNISLLKEKGKGYIKLRHANKGESTGTIPRKFVLDGKWSLNAEHDLLFLVSGKENPGLAGKTIIFSGKIINVGGNSLKFRARETDPLKGSSTYNLSLTGVWQADTKNRITFRVSKAKNRYDTLVFSGKWQVGKSNELIYKHDKVKLKKSDKNISEIVFKGYWDILKGKAVYRLSQSSTSKFAFRVSFKSDVIQASDNKVIFEVGTEYILRKVKRQKKTEIVIFGKWQLNKDLKLIFLTGYPGGGRRKIEFGISKLIGDDKKISLHLLSRKGEKLGVEILFVKAFNNSAELFASLSRTGKEIKLMGGLTVAF